jgi:hypothetical protein
METSSCTIGLPGTTPSPPSGACSWPACDPQHEASSTKSNTPNNAAANPKAAAFLSLSLTSPRELSNRPAGVPRIMVGPPRAETGEPQPGRKSSMTAKAANEASEKARPIRPNAPLRRSRGPAMTGGAFSGSGIKPVALVLSGKDSARDQVSSQSKNAAAMTCG